MWLNLYKDCFGDGLTTMAANEMSNSIYGATYSSVSFASLVSIQSSLTLQFRSLCMNLI